MFYSNIIIPFNPSDCFVLELLVQNLSYNPRIVREFFMQLIVRNFYMQLSLDKTKTEIVRQPRLRSKALNTASNSCERQNAEDGFKKSLEREESILHKQESCTKNQ